MINHIDKSLELLIEGRKCMPHLREYGEGYRISKKQRGVHKEHVVKGQITESKISYLIECIKLLDGNGISYSKTSKSVYFTIGNTLFRLSNHKSRTFEGVTILISWRSDVGMIINSIRKHLTNPPLSGAQNKEV